MSFLYAFERITAVVIRSFIFPRVWAIMAKGSPNNS